VLVSLPSGEPAVYVDHASTGGTILVHGGHSLLGHAAERSALNAWCRGCSAGCGVLPHEAVGSAVRRLVPRAPRPQQPRPP
jgi:hypothetical protein